jgi:cytochrome P450
VKFVSRLRRKYRSNYIYLRMLTAKSLLILDWNGIRHVLDNSPDIYADPKTKRVGMSHFQPDALTISRGAEWRDRRRFNEAVLDTEQDLHRYAASFMDVIRAEAVVTLQRAGGQLAWDDFSDLFERITLRIVFGARADPAAAKASLMEPLRRMMRESNRAFALRRSKYFDGFYARLRRAREEASITSLASLCQHAPATAMTRVDNQIPHWLFAMANTLAINTARALALIVSHGDAEARVREELAGRDLAAAQDIHGLRYLEGCVQEAMRLWPTTPLLARETLREDTLGGASVPVGTQILILNSFNHRDRETLPYADTFSPQVWLSEDLDYRFNHLSNGRQVCAGKNLALFIAKATLAALLAAHRYTLQGPPLNPRRPLPYLYNHFHIRMSFDDA